MSSMALLSSFMRTAGRATPLGAAMLLLAALLLAALPVRAEIYKWVDEHGVTHFSHVAPPGRNADRLAEPKVNGYRPNAPAQNTPVQATPPTAAAAKAEVVLYTTSWCPYCKKARAYLKEKGIAFVDYDVEKDSAAARRKAELDSKSGGTGVPLALINGQMVRGFAPEIYDRALARRP